MITKHQFISPLSLSETVCHLVRRATETLQKMDGTHFRFLLPFLRTPTEIPPLYTIVVYNMKIILFIFACILLAVAGVPVTPRASRVVDEKVNAMDEATKKRILAMQQSGMPKEAIAKKISYVAGGEGLARRMVDRINIEEKRKTYAHQKKQQQAAYRSTKQKR